uniref:G-protein coupled receptors family 2 profile 2 domain-containing protein n=1 Tax=Gadus morhua TaxID=8049 RepID=A0A8C5A2V4_GADMO
GEWVYLVIDSRYIYFSLLLTNVLVNTLNVKVIPLGPGERYLTSSPLPFQDLINAASNMLNQSWEAVNITDGNETVCECSHLTPFSALMSKTTLILPFLDELTYLGLGVSICALLLFLIIEALVWSAVVKSNLSHFRHTSLVNIAVSLLLADLCFLASSFPDKISENVCLVFTICQHLFFLTMFCWMLCLSVMLVHQLIFVFNPLRKRVFMFLSSIVGYIVPMLIVGSTYVYYKYTGSDYRKKGTCWLTYEGLLRGSIHAFLLPVGVVVLTNLFSMCVVILTLTKTAVPDDNKSDAETAKSILKVMLFLTPAFGLTWILGFVITQSGLMIFITYAFTILNSFQVRGEPWRVRHQARRVTTPPTPQRTEAGVEGDAGDGGLRWC